MSLDNVMLMIFAISVCAFVFAGSLWLYDWFMNSYTMDVNDIYQETVSCAVISLNTYVYYSTKSDCVVLSGTKPKLEQHPLIKEWAYVGEL